MRRRALLALFAPKREPAYRGRLAPELCCASYEAKLRRTHLRFLVGGVWRYGWLEHDPFRVSRPGLEAWNFPPPGAATKIRLRVEAGELRAYEWRGGPRLLRALMPVPDGEKVVVSYPNPAHPDLTAFWSVGERLYFTNNDYKNAYRLPETMAEEWAKPLL